MKSSTPTQSADPRSHVPETRLHCPKCGSQLFLVSKTHPDPDKVKCFKCRHSFPIERLRSTSHLLDPHEEELLGIGNKLDYNTLLKEKLRHNQRIIRRIENGLRKLGRPELSKTERALILMHGEYWKNKLEPKPQLTPEEARKRLFLDS